MLEMLPGCRQFRKPNRPEMQVRENEVLKLFAGRSDTSSIRPQNRSIIGLIQPKPPHDGGVSHQDVSSTFTFHELEHRPTLVGDAFSNNLCCPEGDRV